MKKYEYLVEIEHEQTHSSREDIDDPYSHWEEGYTNTFLGIKIAGKERWYGDLTVISDLDLTQQTGYLLWAEWSEGNSFGSTTNGGIEALAILSSKEEAEHLSRKLKAQYEEAKSGDEIPSFEPYKYITREGFELDIPTGQWLGYFEGLENIYIEEVSLRTEMTNE